MLIFVTDCTVNVDLIFLLDGSLSVGSQNFELCKTWVTDVAREFILSENFNVQLGVIQYSYGEKNR